MTAAELSGAALDAAIHERVLGIEHGCALAPMPPYSTDLAAAWKVIERATDYHLWSGGHYLDPPTPIADGRRSHVAKLWFDRGDTSRLHSGQASGETLAVAICRAALNAFD